MSEVGSMFARMVTLPKPTALITTGSSAVQHAAADAAARRSKARGFPSTIMKGFLDQSQLKSTMGS